MGKKIQLKRGLKKDLPILNTAEIGFVTDDEQLYVGTNRKNVRLLDEKDLVDMFNKVSEISVNIKDFGATGDGRTDDTQAFVNALRLASENNSLNLFVPEGTYVLDSFAEIFSNTYIRFDKGAKIVKSANSTTSYAFLIGKSSSSPGYGGGARNITIEGGRFEGYAGTQRGISFTCHHGSNLTFKDMTFYYAIQSGHVFDLSGCNDVLIDGCEFIGFDPASGREFTEAIQIDASTLIGLSTQFSGFDGIPTKDVTVQNCKFLPIKNADGTINKYAPNPIGSHSFVEGNYFSNIKFLNNIVEDAQPTVSGGTYAWIRFYAIDGIEISGNKFINTKSILQTAISLQTKSRGIATRDITTGGNETNVPVLPCKNITIENNKFNGFNNSSNTKPVIESIGDPTTTLHNQNIVIRNNVFTDGWAKSSSRGANVSPNCIEITNTSDVTVDSNRAEIVRRLTYIRYSNDVKVIHNTCNQNHNLSISIEGSSGVWISANNLYMGTGGIFTSDCFDLQIINNRLTSLYDEMYATFGGYIQARNASGVTVSQNFLKSIPNNRIPLGIQVYGSSNNAMVTDNHISGFTTDISVTGTPVNLVRRPW